MEALDKEKAHLQTIFMELNYNIKKNRAGLIIYLPLKAPIMIQKYKLEIQKDLVLRFPAFMILMERNQQT